MAIQNYDTVSSPTETTVAVANATLLSG